MSEKRETLFEEDVRKGNLIPGKIMQYHIDNFNRGGGERPVKVVPADAEETGYVSGFFTQEKFIKGRTPKEMERILGLESGSLENGATIYALTETPNADQFVPAGYTHMPGGRPYEEGGKYPVGAGAKQFELKEDVPATVVGKVDYEEAWTGQPPRQDETHSTSNPEPEESNEYDQGISY